MSAVYTASATATGDGRGGHTRSSDGVLDLDLAVPKEMGGPGGPLTNPEQLFAAGYAACFHSALQSVARSRKLTLTDSSVGGRVGIGPNDQGGFQLEVLLEITLPDLSPDQGRELAEAAHQICPYSNATRGNIEVTLVVVDE